MRSSTSLRRSRADQKRAPRHLDTSTRPDHLVNVPRMTAGEVTVGPASAWGLSTWRMFTRHLVSVPATVRIAARTGQAIAIDPL
jgi:hypothetical protein